MRINYIFDYALEVIYLYCTCWKYKYVLQGISSQLLSAVMSL